METLKFAENLNNKLNCDVFTTLRPYDPKKYFTGAEFRVTVGDNYICTARVIEAIITRLELFNPKLFLIDMAKEKDQAIAYLKSIYNARTDFDGYWQFIFLKKVSANSDSYRKQSEPHSTVGADLQSVPQSKLFLRVDKSIKPELACIAFIEPQINMSRSIYECKIFLKLQIFVVLPYSKKISWLNKTLIKELPFKEIDFFDFLHDMINACEGWKNKLQNYFPKDIDLFILD